MTKQKPTNKLRHDKIFRGIESYGFMHARPGEASKPEFLHMARPKRGQARPTISLELDCDLESEAGRGLGIIKLLNESHEALASISTEIMSG